MWGGLGGRLTAAGMLPDPDPGVPSITAPPDPALRIAAIPPAHPCLSLPSFSTDDSLYESPEPIFTSNNSCCSLRVPPAALAVVPVVWTLLVS